MSLSLRQKMILAFSAVVIVAIAGIVLFANIDSERQVNNFVTRGGQYGINELAIELEAYYRQHDSWVGFESVINPSGGKGGRNNLRGKNFMWTLLDEQQRVIWSLAGHQIGNVITVEANKDARELKADGAVVGYLLVNGDSIVDINEITPFVSRLRQVLLYAGGLAIILAIALAILISNYLLRPVKALTEASTILSSGDFSTRVDVRGNDELAVLAKTFNQMAGNLQLAEERKKSLTADVAHELRTPIAVQKAQLEGMIDGVLPVTDENLGVALEQVDFLSRMVDDLRLLAMADAGEVRLEGRKTDLRQLIMKVVSQFPTIIEETTRIKMDFLPDDSEILITTDPDRLTQILQNLITNAIRYGKKGGLVLVTTCKQDNMVSISVTDDGKGIPEEALPHIFERFYRHEKARSRETGGTGLGLAISKKLALLMGGDLTGANAPEGGAVFTLILPMK